MTVREGNVRRRAAKNLHAVRPRCDDESGVRFYPENELSATTIGSLFDLCNQSAGCILAAALKAQDGEDAILWQESVQQEKL